MFLVDTSVLSDMASDDPVWGDWSAATLTQAIDLGEVCVNQIVVSEFSANFNTAGEVEMALTKLKVARASLPFAAAFLASRAYQTYRRRGGARTSILPDFLIAAHAAVEGRILITRDPRPVRDHFPGIALITPD